MKYTKGDTVIIQDGRNQRSGVVVKDGIDSQNRVRVLPKGIPLEISVSLNPQEKIHIIN